MEGLEPGHHWWRWEFQAVAMSPTPSSLEQLTMESWLPRVRMGTEAIHEWSKLEK